MIERLGNEYGGHWVDLDLVPDGSTVLSCGVGRDVSFSEELAQRRAVKIVFVDPSWEALEFAQARLSSCVLVHRAVAKRNGLVQVFTSHGSESLYPEHRSCDGGSRHVEGITLTELVREHRPSLVKLDIEGTEYDVLWQCDGVPQITVEFHHDIVPRFTAKDSKAAVDEMVRRGYEAIWSGDRDVVFKRTR